MDAFLRPYKDSADNQLLDISHTSMHGGRYWIAGRNVELLYD